MSNIFETNTSNIMNSWMRDIRLKNINNVQPISFFVSAKLIIFAWTYATYQTNELKNRLGSSVKFFDAVESIFCNKLAQIAMALYLGFTDDDIFDGKTFITLDPSSKDERFACADQLYYNDRLLTVSGTKKYLYPTIKKYTNDSQLFVYIDAVRYVSDSTPLPRLNIKDNFIKVTLIGCANKFDLRDNQDQSKFLGYSKSHTSFTGLNILKPVEGITFGTRQYIVPQYVKEIKCSNDLKIKLDNIIETIKSYSEVKPIQKIDYHKLFRGMIT